MKNEPPEYLTWRHMKGRCLNPKNKDYPLYGGRGIKIDARWHAFEHFFADMGPRPTPAHTLERMRNSGNYTKNNCCWATRTTQAQNRRTNKIDKTIADDIRKLYAAGGFTQRELAIRYGVANSLIAAVLMGDKWK